MRKFPSLNQYDTDKSDSPGYIETYEKLLGPIAEEPIRLFELGVFKGGSLLLWHDYLPQGHIVGLDVNPIALPPKADRIRFYQGEQQDIELLDRIAVENAPEGFDIIIDDASHIGHFTRISFWHLFVNHLKPGGRYIIEDWGCSYWDAYPDGKSYTPPSTSPGLHEKFLIAMTKNRFIRQWPLILRLVTVFRNRMIRRSFPSHTFGMVGFIKELVDEVAMADITNLEKGAPPQKESRIRCLHIKHGQVIVEKTLVR